ncbi:hypothetical protein V1279_002082 [Bradyrhizobium sp. AZCC 1610]|uniref:hypothetical protein n=1 Tax=Bradyrhizobium sp. AZCC 1610 TaxID=3117020 RepID=UPI002FF2B4D5
MSNSCFQANAAASQASGIRQGFKGRQAERRNYFLVPVPAFSMLEGALLDELQDFIFPVTAPVVVLFHVRVLGEPALAQGGSDANK